MHYVKEEHGGYAKFYPALLRISERELSSCLHEQVIV